MEKYKLLFPIKADGQELKELTVRRPTVRDLKNSRRACDNSEQDLQLLADLTNIAPKDLENMDLADYNAIWEIVGKFRAGATTTTS